MSPHPAGPRLRGSREYEVAYLELLGQATDEITSQHPLLGNIREIQSKHRGRLRHVHANKVLDRDTSVSKIEVSMSSEDILRLNVDAHTTLISDFAEAEIQHHMPEIARVIAQMTEFTDRALPKDARAFSWDNYLVMLSRIEIPFDDDGSFELPQLWGPPDRIQTLPFPDDFNERLLEILMKKKEEWFASKRTRRLSRPAGG